MEPAPLGNVKMRLSRTRARLYRKSSRSRRPQDTASVSFLRRLTHCLRSEWWSFPSIYWSDWPILNQGLPIWAKTLSRAPWSIQHHSAALGHLSTAALDKTESHQPNASKYILRWRHGPRDAKWSAKANLNVFNMTQHWILKASS